MSRITRQMRRPALLGFLLALGLVAAGCGESKQTKAELHAARASRPRVFSIFPAHEGRQQCFIPFVFEGEQKGRSPGSCETRVHTVRAFDSKGYIGNQKVAIVSFTERLPDQGSEKAKAITGHTWWVYERLGPGVRVLGWCDLEPSWGVDNEATITPCKSPSPFGRLTREAQLKAAFAGQGIELKRDPEPHWPQGNIGLVAPGKAYVEMQLRQPGVPKRPPKRLPNMQYGFARQGNVEVWFNRDVQDQVKRVLRALRCEGSETACRRNPAVSPPALQAVNGCLAAHHLSIVQEALDQPYEGRSDDPGNRTVKRYEYVTYTSPSASNDVGEVALFATTHDAQTYASYWQAAARSQVRSAPVSRRAGATRHIAWVRDSPTWAPAKTVAGCVEAHG